MTVFMACAPQKKSIPLEDGVSKTLADFRKERVSEVKYALSFDIPIHKSENIPASLDLSFQLKSRDADLYLDFSDGSDKLLALSVNGDSIGIAHELEHIRIPREKLMEGKNQVQVDFIAGENSLNRNEEYLYTLLVPDRARSLFPCFDQPDIKAKYQLTITAPKDWQVMCGAPVLSKREVGDAIVHQFGVTDKMSTYLFSFVAGKFQTAKVNPGSFEMELFYRETSKAKAEPSIPEIFKLHQESIDFLEDYTAFPFPFQKMDFAAIPIFQYGGMEHVGAIQYKEPSLFLDSTATDNQLLGRAKLIAHETAHMWFGDLVTMNWFEDVWLKEVFANFMADKIVNPSFPDINHDLLFLVSHYPAAYGEDRTQGSNPIKQPLDNLQYSGTLYGNIIYHKAPIMMRQLEAVMGKEAFQKGIQEYMQTFQYSNATWADLVGILDKETNVDLKKWSEVWVNQAGRPVIKDEISYNDQGLIESFKILQEAEDGSNNFWPQMFEVALVYEEATQVFTVDMNEPEISMEQAIDLAEPKSIIYNSNGFGYGVFPVQEKDLEVVPELEDDLARAQAYINVYENTLAGKLEPLATLEMLKSGLALEEDDLIVRLITGQSSHLFWTYLTQEQRDRFHDELVKLLYERLQQEVGPNSKKALFGLYSSLAYTEDARERLYLIWSKKESIPTLRLNEDDFTAMAMKLILFEHPKAPDIIAVTREAISNPDEKDRFEFLLPAISSDESRRDQMAVSFKEAANREKEAWVATALTYLNHPLRQDTGIKHLGMYLDLLEEVQRTGDIFFPKAWLSSSIGQYSSEEAYEILKSYLAENPDVKPSLKRKLLQAADDLYRIY
ncbi:M1 family aminopeptidase [Echinicola sediminis]